MPDSELTECKSTVESNHSHITSEADVQIIESYH